MQQMFEVALDAAAMVDQVGRRDGHVLRDVKTIGADALDDDVALAAADDEIVLLGIGPDVLETVVDAIGQIARRLVLLRCKPTPPL